MSPSQKPEAPGAFPASRLGSYAAKWIDNVTDQAVANLNAQSKLLKSYEGASIVADIQDVTRSLYQIWFKGLDKLMTRE